ncbi:MAG: hypothetical protein U9Q69_00010 [Nanoarchaeota archaeon]|nr:hypothetical protein [Nanoarchaeota archaeon]
MVKIHAKQKRMSNSATHLKGIRSNSRNRKKRPKTFKSEAAAKGWAEKNSLKKFKLVNLRLESSKDKKIKIVAL